jgi:hypothetical protein
VLNGFNQTGGAQAAASRVDVADRRRFLRIAALAGLGVCGVGALGATAGTAFAGAETNSRGPGDLAVLNFLLNLAYLAAEFHLRGAYGKGLEDELVGGAGRVGRLGGGRPVTFADPLHRQHAEEIAGDARAHVAQLRGVLGPARVGRPPLDLDGGFAAVAGAAGLADPGGRFDVFGGEDGFLLGAFLLAEWGMTAHRGALPLLSAGPFQDTVSGILASTAVHAGTVRTMLLARGLGVAASAVTDAGDALSGRAPLDRGAAAGGGRAGPALADVRGTTPARPPGRVLNVVYQSPRAVGSGGFFPLGVNGEINRSHAEA